MFSYKSELVLSKSWLNRALIIERYCTGIDLKLESLSDDVQLLKQAIQQIGKTSHFYLGQGGTSFRFFCFLISRLPGEWTVAADPRLFERPQKSISKILSQLGVGCEFRKQDVLIQSQGWKIPETIFCETQQSSQFISALVLNSWNLTHDLQIEIQLPIPSDDYLKMTLLLVKKFGLTVKSTENVNLRTLLIKALQEPINRGLQAEVDVSSAFSLAAAAVIAGEVEITNWNSNSIQPDLIFLKVFDQMKISYQQSKGILKIKHQKEWHAISFNLNQSPDLFPVLAVLCALAEGTSHLFGGEVLQFKESNRLQKTKELLDLAGFESELKDDGLVIFGKSSNQDKKKLITFDPDQDHRMAMAAALLKLAGYFINILNPEVVKKSYPDFWTDIGLQP
jgi:3-phosphoshikimate 1-carboxyvinyltransferase